MINLIHATPSRDALSALLRDCPPRPLLPPLGSAVWTEALRKPLLAPALRELLTLANAERTTQLPVLTDELYGHYNATGVRLPFERVYFARRRQFARAAVALLAEGGADRAESFVAKLRDIFSEVSWALPSHVKTSTGKDAGVIDLFAAETANLMAECLNVFGSVIPAELQAEMRRRLREQIFDRYLQEPPIWWTTNTSNWNAVCHQGVLGAALAVVDDPDLLADLLLRAAAALPAFLSGYGNDGACSEGPGYWVYGFGWFTVLNEQLETRSGGRLSLFAGDEKIRRIAAYGPTAVFAKHRVVNFSDCAAHIVLRPSLLAYLGDRLDLPECCAEAAFNYAWLTEHPPAIEEQRSDLFHWLRHFLHCPADAGTTNAAPTIAKTDRFFPDLSVWIVRGRDHAGHLWELAAKGGHNDEHHNHNDVGSLILNVNGTPFLSEIGAPEYQRGFFGPDRYQHIAARSLGHSVPLINGREQAAGASHLGRVRRAETARDEVGFELDLAAAYPAEADCRSAVRTVVLHKTAGRARLTDHIVTATAQAATETAFVTHAEEVVIESPAVAFIRRDGLTLELRAAPGLLWQRVETHPYRGHQGQDLCIRRLVLGTATPQTESLFDVELSLRE